MGTESVDKQNEEPEIIILKEVRVNHISVAAVTDKAEEGRSGKEEKENQEKKQATKSGTMRRKLSRQEKLYRDIVRDSLTPVSKRSRGIQESEDRKNQAMAYARKERREAEKQRWKELKKKHGWNEKVQQWSPSQSWPITESSERTEDNNEGKRLQRSNRETYLYLKF